MFIPLCYGGWEVTDAKCETNVYTDLKWLTLDEHLALPFLNTVKKTVVGKLPIQLNLVSCFFVFTKFRASPLSFTNKNFSAILGSCSSNFNPELLGDVVLINDL